MRHRLEGTLRRWLVRWVLAVEARAGLILASIGAASLVFGGYAALNLRLNADTVDVVRPDVRSARLLAEFSRVFPILDHTTLVVVDGETPEATRDAALAIRDRLRSQPERYQHVFAPGLGEFFERNGLLYLSVEELWQFADQLTELQPLIAELERDPSLTQLADLVEEARDQGLLSEEEAGVPWVSLFQALTRATEAVHAETQAREVPWETLLLQELDRPMGTRALVLVEPVVDFSSLGATREAIDAIRSEAVAASAGRAQVRITGNAAINLEELVNFFFDIVVGGAFCFVLVTLILRRAFKSWQMMAAALVTLLAGLVWTAAAAAAMVGHVGLVSMAFGILFIGLGVDFAIHLGMAYASARRLGQSHHDSLTHSVEEVGPSLVLCTFTTAIGFYVFVPTPFIGLAELGLIAGTGMVIILFLTLTLLPALLSRGLRVPIGREAEPLALPLTWSRGLATRHGWIRAAAAVVALASLALLPQARFDSMVFGMRDPSTESVQAFEDLMKLQNQLSPLFADVLAPDLASAEELGRRLESLDTVESSITLASFVPDEQEEKIAILEDLAFLLDPGTGDGDEPAAHSAEEQADAVARVAGMLADEAERPGDPEVRAEMRRLSEALDAFLAEARTRGQLAESLDRLQRATLEPLPRHLERLRMALGPSEITLSGLPQELVDRQVAVDGRVRVTAYPAEDLYQTGALERFVSEVQTIAPDATGMAPNVVGFARATIDSFQQALLSALALISVLLWLLWQRVKEPVLVLTPLLLGAVLTVASMVIFDIAFNFCNVLVIPLLLGAGVDSGIHLVQRGALKEHDAELLSSTTARAVLYSALTTILSFGALGLSDHGAMSSLGTTLTLGMLCMLFANLVVLPALIDRWPPHQMDAS